MFEETKVGMGLGKIKTLGIVPTKFRKSTIEHQENLDMLRREYGDLVWVPMNLSITWQEATMQKRTVFSYDPQSSAAKQGWRIVAQALQVLEGTTK
jgi:cellulose biosynthesis protein BcsQ